MSAEIAMHSFFAEHVSGKQAGGGKKESYFLGNG
jgi:hypothetical protein